MHNTLISNGWYYFHTNQWVQWIKELGTHQFCLIVWGMREGILLGHVCFLHVHVICNHKSPKCDGLMWKMIWRRMKVVLSQTNLKSTLQRSTLSVDAASCSWFFVVIFVFLLLLLISYWEERCIYCFNWRGSVTWRREKRSLRGQSKKVFDLNLLLRITLSLLSTTMANTRHQGRVHQSGADAQCTTSQYASETRCCDALLWRL
jgi:hypothetical protein